MQPTEKNYEKTQVACFVGYIVQAIVNNFVPLLFLTFQSQYGIPLSQITLLVTLNFGLQLLVDLASVKVWIRSATEPRRCWRTPRPSPGSCC